MDYKKLIAELIDIEGINSDGLEGAIQIPKESGMGDYTLPCFRFAKVLRKPPQQIAEELAESIDKPEFLEKIEGIGGYLNFYLDNNYFLKRTVERIIEEGKEYGCSDIGNGKTICIDYSSINIAKPFHIGHLSTTVIGAALYRIYKSLGYNVVGINHLGDWGTQFGKLIVAYKEWGDKVRIQKDGIRELLRLYVKFHDQAEIDSSLDERGREWFKKIEDGDREAYQIFDYFKEITLKEVDRVYKRLNITFDSYNGESFYNDKMGPVIRELEEKKLLKTSDGAKVVELEGMPPCLLMKADGATLYATRDIAAAFYRKNTYNFDKCLYVVAYQQNLHFKQVFEVIRLMGYPWHQDLVHIAFGMVSLEDGTLSTRRGKVVFLEEVLDKAVEKCYQIIEEKNPDLENKKNISEQVGIGAVVFSTLQNNRIKDIVFSYDKVLNFDGETGPYVQYTHARCSSVLEKAEIGVITDWRGIDNPEAAELIRYLSRYPEVVLSAAEKYEPSYITRHIVDIAQLYNKFYYERRILDAEEGMKNARLKLTLAVRTVIANGLSLLGIQAPDKM